MHKPLKDIIADLEAKHKGIQLLYDLNERRRVIADFYRDTDYMFRRFESYVEDVKFVLENKLEVDFITRLTLNLILIMDKLCDSILSYRHAIEFYLMDECSEKNSELKNRFHESIENLNEFFEKLNKNGVFNVVIPRNNDVLNRFLIFEEPDDTDDVSYGKLINIININREALEQMNAAELIICLDYQLQVFNNNLLALKMMYKSKDRNFLELSYELNFLLYAKHYWPTRCENFRAHITQQRLRGNIDINGLEELKKEAIYQFEYHTPTGRIWRDYSEDIPQMAIQMKKSFLKEKKNEDEEQWKYFFQRIFELEEYDRWIEELRNPELGDYIPETIEQKIALCFTSNILDVNKPNLLYFLMLAMWTRRMLKSKEIPDFVRMVKEAYPEIINDNRTEELVIFAIQNMNKKTDKYYDEFVKDQNSMIEYVDSLYPKKKNGERRKDAQAAVDLTNKLFLALK